MNSLFTRDRACPWCTSLMLGSHDPDCKVETGLAHRVQRPEVHVIPATLGGARGLLSRTLAYLPPGSRIAKDVWEFVWPEETV